MTLKYSIHIFATFTFEQFKQQIFNVIILDREFWMHLLHDTSN